MTLFVTKTREQAAKERETHQNESTCPSCEETSHIGTITTKIGGLFSKTKKMKNYSCIHCGCEWNTGWKEE